MGKVKSFFGGLIGVLLLSVIVFFIIYFFVPAVSMKFFGIAFNENSDSGSEIVALIDSLELGDDAARAEIESYLSSPAGQEAVSAIQDAASKAGESFDAFVESDDYFLAPGHNSVIIEDDRGQMWTAIHSYADSQWDHGHPLSIMQVFFDEDGWPYVPGNQVPRKALAPIFDR